MGKIPGGFIDRYEWAKAWSKGMGPSARAVLYVLADYSNKGGFCYPGMALIREETGGLSYHTIRRALRTLQDKHVVRVMRKGGSAKEGQRLNTLYQLSGGRKGWRIPETTGIKSIPVTDPTPCKSDTDPLQIDTSTGADLIPVPLANVATNLPSNLPIEPSPQVGEDQEGNFDLGWTSKERMERARRRGSGLSVEAIRAARALVSGVG